MFRPHLSYIAAISVNRRTSGYPWRGGPVRSDFQWRLLYPVNLRCLARSGRWRQRSSKWLGMLVIMLWTRCQVLISHLHNSWILNHSNVHIHSHSEVREKDVTDTDTIIRSIQWISLFHCPNVLSSWWQLCNLPTQLLISSAAMLRCRKVHLGSDPSPRLGHIIPHARLITF